MTISPKGNCFLLTGSLASEKGRGEGRCWALHLKFVEGGSGKMKKDARGKSSLEADLGSPHQSLPIGKNLKNFKGGDLLKSYPIVFDKRVPDEQRFNLITLKQFQEYLGGLKCAVCGKAGGKCKCQPEDLVDEQE
jgi:hypothetical protein